MSKLTKMSLSNIQGVLSREEMSKIMAGSGGTHCGFCKKFGGTTHACFTDPTLGGACMGCEGLCY